MLNGVIFLLSTVLPSAPGPECWRFRDEFKTPVAYHAREAYVTVDEYGLTGRLQTVQSDLKRYFSSSVRQDAVKKLTIRRACVEGRESFRCEVDADRNVVLTANDEDGVRRAVCWFEDRESAGDIRPIVRRPWVRNRISRCFFGPIKRPPYNHDELMDDIDYYPPAYLDRLAHEGINGLWITVEWRDLAETSFTKRHPNAEKRLSKLRRTVERCLDYGIKMWIFSIEPKAVDDADPLLAAHPELFSAADVGGGRRLMCPSSQSALQYIEESVRDIFAQVPGLGGLIMIANGERPTTCLSTVHPVTGGRHVGCLQCDGLRPWQMYEKTADAIRRGMKAAGSSGEYISWFYHPQVPARRADWVAETVRHVPRGTVFAYNFESGGERRQLGKVRHGGDYWLSYVGPSEGFAKVSAVARESRVSLGAKIQVGCSHEVATVPFVPVPGLLYRKYKAMREMDVSTVLQCWYFGNCPGVMNKAAGELSFDDFADDEDSFLMRLAAPEWRGDAERVAMIWKQLSDAYSEYPLSNGIQYYGPFHAGVVWPLLVDVELRPLARTWRPDDPPSGDAIGEALDQHDLSEVVALSRKMAKGVSAVDGALTELADRWRKDPARIRDISVMRALEYQFESGANVFEFYYERANAIRKGRGSGKDTLSALTSLRRMSELVKEEIGITERLLPFSEADSRLGFHSEAESHLYHPALLQWRVGQLGGALARIDEIKRMIADGGDYPESAFERGTPRCRCGEWTDGRGGVRFCVTKTNGACGVELVRKPGVDVIVRGLDPLAVEGYRVVEIPSTMGERVSVRLEGEIGWLGVFDREGLVWPNHESAAPSRLNIGRFYPSDLGRIVSGD